jgi:hypothetical protein
MFSTGNAPKDLIIDQCYMADHIDAKSMIDSKKRKRKSIPGSSRNRNLTPVTIMVAVSIGAVRSRKLMKVLLDSGSTRTLINKKCLPKKCKPCQISQSRMVNIPPTAMSSLRAPRELPDSITSIDLFVNVIVSVLKYTNINVIWTTNIPKVALVSLKINAFLTPTNCHLSSRKTC